MMRYKYIVFSFSFLSGLFFIGCGEPVTNQEEDDLLETPSEVVTEDSKNISTAQKVFYAMPSPFELATMLRSSGVSYDPSILNDVKNISKYSTSKTQSLNLGIYGADLSISSIFGQTQATMFYLSCIKTLSDQLGVSSAFNKQKMERLDVSKNNKDSLQKIVSESYLIANAYLKDNDRVNMSSLILAGGWTEGLYIATQLAKGAEDNEDLVELIADQRFSLENLIGLLDANTDAENIVKDFKDLNQLFQKIDSDTDAKTELKITNNITTIGGGDEVTISEELLAEITEKIKEIRGKYIE